MNSFIIRNFLNFELFITHLNKIVRSIFLFLYVEIKQLFLLLWSFWYLSVILSHYRIQILVKFFIGRVVTHLVGNFFIKTLNEIIALLLRSINIVL